MRFWISQQFLRSFPSLADTERQRKRPSRFQLEWRIMGSEMGVGEGTPLRDAGAIGMGTHQPSI